MKGAQVRALVWKNLRQRSMMDFVFDLGIPILIGFMFNTMSKRVTNKVKDAELSVPSEQYYMLPTDIKHFCGAYYPKSAAGEKLKKYIGKALGVPADNMTGYTSLPEGFKNHSGKQCNPKLPLLHYVDLSDSATEIPKHLKYLIVLSDTSINTEEIFTSDTADTFDLREVLLAQKLVTEAFMMNWSPANLQKAVQVKLAIQEMPIPERKVAEFKPAEFLSMFSGFIFLSIIIKTTKGLVAEKQYKLKESLKLMGVSNSIYWLSWFLAEIFWFILIAVVFATFITVAKPKRVLSSTDPSLVYVFFIIWAIDAMSFSFLFSCFANKAYASVVQTMVVFLVLHVAAGDMGSTMSSVLGKCVLGTLVFNIALDTAVHAIVVRDMAGEGYTWSTITELPEKDAVLSLSISISLVVLNSIFNFFVLWYIDNISPGEFGVPQPWYFCVTKAYWCPKPASDEKVGELPLQGEDYFEPEVSGQKAGIKLRNLVKVFSGKVAVAGTNLNIYQELITVLLGHNGAGKTTTMAMITGFTPPTKGTALVNGFDVSKNLPEARKSLGLCPQHDILFPGLTCQDHLEFYSALKDIKVSKQDVRKLLDDVGLLPKQKTKARKLSGGQRRKLSVAIAFIGNPKVVVLDEPSSGLDPSARRDMWAFLKGLRENRTLLLTTHYMDEADNLGDRIAIMAEGVVKCYGTPMFLKNTYGVGYRLLIAMEPQCSLEHLITAITNIIPSAQFLTKTQSEAYYTLPDEQLSMFPKLFRTLENNSKTLKIKSFGLEGTSMDEVFTKVGSGFDPDGDRRKATVISEDPKKHGQRQDKDLFDLETYVCNTDMTRSLQQMRGILTKKAILTKRHWIVTLIQILLCPVFLFLGLYSDSGAHLVVQNPLWYSLDSFKYTTTVPVLYYPGVPRSVIQPYIDLIESPHKVAIKQMEYTNSTKVDPVNDYYLESAEELGLYKYERHYMVGAVFNPGSRRSNLVAMYNTKARHGPAISAQLLMNFHVKSFLKDRYSIMSGVEPIAGKMGDVQSPLPEKTLFSLGTSLAILPAIFVYLLIQEREVGARHLQRISGVSPIIYWFATFLWDFLLLLIVIVSLMLTFLYNPTIYITEQRWTLTLLILVVFALAMLPNVYFYQLLFKKPGSGVAAVILFNVLIGMMGSLMIVAVKGMAKAEGTQSNVLDTIDILFTITSPIYNLTLCILCITLTSLRLKVKNAPSWSFSDYFEDNVTLVINSNLTKPFVSLAVMFPAYFILVILHDYNVIRTLWYMLQSKKDPPDDSFAEDGEDFDVQAERKRIASTPLPELFKTDALILKNLLKKYGDFTAVYGTSVGMPQSECFGLLGQNGAGKSTTFKMLTGDIKITSGHSYLLGKSIRHDIKKVQSYMGYCPQDDGLHEQLTGRETLYLYGRLRGVPEKDLRPVSDQLLELLTMSEHADRRTKTYSGGTKRKLSTGIALIGNPNFVLLDEPTCGMDPSARRALWSVFHNVRASGKTIVMTSHSMEECDALCTRIAIQVGGKLKCLGSPQYLKSKFGQGYTITIHIGIGGVPEAANKTDPERPSTVEKITPESETTEQVEEVQTAEGDETESERSGRSYERAKSEGSESDVNVSGTLYDFITTALPGATMLYEQPGYIYFRLPETGLRLSRIFKVMELTRTNYGVLSYSVHQTTLEQVFLAFVEKDRERPKGSTLLGTIKGICN